MTTKAGLATNKLLAQQHGFEAVVSPGKGVVLTKLGCALNLYGAVEAFVEVRFY